MDLGTDRFGYGFGGTGKKSNAKQFDNYGEAFGMHDVIGCFLDLARGEIKFSKNGVDLGVAFALNAQQKSQTYYPAVVLKNAEMAFNFGAQPFKHPPPNDYVAVSSAPKESIKHNSVSSNQNQSKEGDKPTNNAPQAIIIEPSRELAEQTYNQIQKVNENLNKFCHRDCICDINKMTLSFFQFKIHLKNPTIRELLVIGGVNVKEQIAILNSGVDIVVGTPGRLEDLIQGGYLLLTHCR